MAINKEFRVKHGLISEDDVQVNGSVTATSFIGDGSQLTGIDYSSLSNLPSIVKAAVAWSPNHTLVDGTRYLAGDVVYDNGNIYVANYDNESLPTSNTLYWTNLGPGNRLNIDGRDVPNISYAQLSNTPSFATVATTGSYNDLLDKPNLSILASVSTLQFDTTYNGPTPTGQLSWNSGDGTLDLGLAGGTVVLQVGQEQVQRIWNDTGATLTQGQVVYVTGSQGQRLTVGLANAGAESTSSKTFGVVTEDILNQSEGYITTEGLVRNINTSNFAQGAALWLSPTTAGLITTTKPTAPQHLVLVGFCIRQHQSSGVIFVKVQNGYELDELHDVLINGKANNDVLKYDSATGVWKNAQLGAVAYSNSYTDLTNKPTNVSSFTNDSGYLTSVSAGSLTGTTLNSTIANSSLTSVGTLTSLNTSGSVTANASTAFIAGAEAESNVALQMPRESALRNPTNGFSNMYFDVSNGGTTHGAFQFRSSNGYTNVLTMSPTVVTFNTGATVTARTASMARTGFNAPIDTEIIVDELRFRISNQGGIFPQVIGHGSSRNLAWTGVGAISGSAVAQVGSTGTIVASNAWTTLYNVHGMDSAGDTVTVTLQDKAGSRIYRVTFMRSDNGSTIGYNIIAERIL